jgi:hypothetical protein
MIFANWIFHGRHGPSSSMIYRTWNCDFQWPEISNYQRVDTEANFPFVCFSAITSWIFEKKGADAGMTYSILKGTAHDVSEQILDLVKICQVVQTL